MLVLFEVGDKVQGIQPATERAPDADKPGAKVSPLRDRGERGSGPHPDLQVLELGHQRRQAGDHVRGPARPAVLPGGGHAGVGQGAVDGVAGVPPRLHVPVGEGPVYQAVEPAVCELEDAFVL